MISLGIDYPVEPYSAYRNRTVNKHLDKIKNQLRQIKDCSLKADDKRKLLNQLAALIEAEFHPPTS
jgi:hypothetical protein